MVWEASNVGQDGRKGRDFLVGGECMDIFVDNLVQVWDDDGDGIVALDGITHHFGSAKLTCLLGPSGCGKSTLVQIIGGIERATSGTIRIGRGLLDSFA